jgi:hypothetical protein
MNKIRIGSAVTAHAMPTPRTNCSREASGPIQPGKIDNPVATTLPKRSGTPSAKAAVMPLSQRLAHVARKSNSMPAIHTKIITAHQAIPLSA